MDEVIVFETGQENEGERLDLFLSDVLSDMTRSRIKRLIQEDCVLIDGKVAAKAGYKLKKSQQVRISMPELKELTLSPENIPLSILYEDSDLIVVNKPQGMVVHPAPGHYSGTLVNALLFHCKDLSGINGVLRPGIVHRIDKDTSGSLVIAKNDYAHASLAAQIKHHSVLRRYCLVVHGCPSNESGTITTQIGRHAVYRKKMAVLQSGGRKAVTHYRVLEKLGSYSLVEAHLETGRTHQVRVHMAFIGHPLVGDPVYGVKKLHFALPGQTLHAKTLGFVHPRSQEYMEFTAPEPDSMRNLLVRLRHSS